MTTPSFEANLIKFLADLNVMLSAGRAGTGMALLGEYFHTDRGPKYAKIWKGNKSWGDRASVYAFVRLKTGDVFKPAGCKGPAKHARGNIFTYSRVTEFCSPTSVHSLRAE